MPLQNRVAPDGTLHTVAARGLFMGNRGGRIHDPATQKLLNRRWVSKRWICCLTQFKDRRRSVMGPGYTEVFFVDEVTALAAGHRPCAFCRRADFQAFQAAWQRSFPNEPFPSADHMDAKLHTERLTNQRARLRLAPWSDIPDGAMVQLGADAYAVSGNRLLKWTFSGYSAAIERPSSGNAALLTPPSIVELLKYTFKPIWHPSAYP